MSVIAAALLSACGESSEKQGNTVAQQEQSSVAVNRVQDAVQISRGEKLYAENCASCHGTFGQGAFNWRKPGPDGKYLAPPLNGTGHAWHHPTKVLRYVIMNGSPGGQGNMPAWKGKLSNQDIDDVIAWFQSRWPDEIYAVWYKRELGSKK
jgi:mono/diheme cytochrome c family protein